MQTINSAVRWWAARQPDRLALSVAGSGLSYAEFNARVERVAGHLLAEGASPGDRIAICANNSLDYWTLAFGAFRIGAICAPLHMRYTTTELAERVEDYRPALIFAGEAQHDRFAGAQVPVLPVPQAAALPDPGALPDDPSPDAPAVIIMTSGSTAKPKGVVLCQRGMTAYSNEWSMQEKGMGRGARVIGSGLASTAAGFTKVPQYLVTGASFYYEADFDAQRFLDLIVSEKITTFTGVPIFFERVAACPGFAEADLSSITTATTAGAPVTRGVQDRWAAKGIIVRQGYGQTECGGMITVMDAAGAGAHPEKCGRGGPYTDLLTVDEEGRPCAPNQPGEILVRGPAAMLGYWDNPEETAKVLRDGWIRTSDIGKLDENGDLTFVARMKDIIISGGLNISCVELEHAISGYDGIVEVAVVGVEDSRFGETALAVVYSEGALSVPQLIEFCNQNLADYKVPRYVVVEPEPLPRLPMGKIDKPTLRARYAAAQATLSKVR